MLRAETHSNTLLKALLSVFTSRWRDRDTGREDMTRWTSSVERDEKEQVSDRQRFSFCFNVSTTANKGLLRHPVLHSVERYGEVKSIF